MMSIASATGTGSGVTGVAKSIVEVVLLVCVFWNCVRVWIRTATSPINGDWEVSPLVEGYD